MSNKIKVLTTGILALTLAACGSDDILSNSFEFPATLTPIPKSTDALPDSPKLATANNAYNYCLSIGARLPFAEEMLNAQKAGLVSPQAPIQWVLLPLAQNSVIFALYDPKTQLTSIPQDINIEAAFRCGGSMSDDNPTTSISNLISYGEFSNVAFKEA